MRSVRLWAAKRVKGSGQRHVRRSATDRDDLVISFAAASSTVDARLGWRFCGARVSGAEPAMVRYRLGCRRGGNGRRGGLPSLWAQARMGLNPIAGTAAAGDLQDSVSMNRIEVLGRSPRSVPATSEKPRRSESPRLFVFPHTPPPAHTNPHCAKQSGVSRSERW